MVKNGKVSAVKHFIEKPILFDFVNLSTTFCSRLSEETDFHSQLSPDPPDFTFSEDFRILKTHSLFKLIFRATQLQQRRKYDIFQKALFCTLASSTNAELNVVPIVAGQYLGRGFTFFC